VKVLAITPGHRIQREQAMEQPWPDRPADAALNNLHQALRVARTALSVTDEAGQRILVLRDGVLRLSPNGELWVVPTDRDQCRSRLETGHPELGMKRAPMRSCDEVLVKSPVT
jgi:DNA-binding SARP family transcriptional activator